MIYWITGRKNSGKTTLAHKLKKQIPDSMVLDGDEVRVIWKNASYTNEGRAQNLETISRIALLLEKQGYTVIIACVSPIKKDREYFQSFFNKCLEIGLPFGELWKGTTYEE